MKLNHEVLEIVNETKLLGTVLTSDLKWDKNTENTVKKAYAKMEILRKMSGFGAPIGDLKKIYLTYIRTHCEQSSTVWHSGLTELNKSDLERVQKVALKIILKDKYINYENALMVLDLESLEQRRNELALTFAKKCLSNSRMKHLFKPNKSTHIMKPRNHEIFNVIHANTERLKNSPVVYMQNILNYEARKKNEINSLWNN